jgi:hypothetical protein
VSFIQDASGFITYDIFKERTVRIWFKQLKNKSAALVFQTNAGEMIASKVDTPVAKPTLIKFRQPE